MIKASRYSGPIYLMFLAILSLSELHEHVWFMSLVLIVFTNSHRVRSLRKTDIKLNTLKFSYNRLLIDCPFLHGGATNECAGTTICMPPS